MNKNRMKGIWICVLLSLFALTEVLAQEAEFGVRAGLNVSSLGASSLNYVPRLAYHVGGTAEFITTPFFSVQTELMYSLQGTALDNSRQIHLNYHYLLVPLMAKAYFYEDASFLLGIQYGYLINAVETNEINKTNRKDQVNNHDFSAVFGLSYKLNERWNFDIRYNLGITNTANQDIIYEQRLTNKVLQLSFGYIF